MFIGQDGSTYYGSLEGMLRKYDLYAHQDSFKGTTLDEFRRWATQTRSSLAELLGLARMEQPDQPPVLLQKQHLSKNNTMEKVLLCCEPKIYMPLYLLIPSGTVKGVFIALPGHKGVGKESVAGRQEDDAVRQAIVRYHYDYGLYLAEMGYVTVCPDSRGFGERRDESMAGADPAQRLGCSCFQLAHMAEGMGETVAGMLLWDNRQIIDYLVQRNEWSLDNLGCIGFSGGGSQALWLAAMDERIQQAFISGYFYGVRDSLMILNSNCSCNYVPHLWRHYDMGDIASLIAPRPLMIQSCRQDPLNGPRGMENVREQMEVLQRAYALFGASESLVHDVFEGGHQFHSDHLAQFLAAFDQQLSQGRAFDKEDGHEDH